MADFANGSRLNYSFTCFSRAAGGKLVIVGDNGVIRRDGGRLLISAGPDKPLQPVPLAEGAEAAPEVQMYREFFQNVRQNRASPLRPEVAIESAKLAYGADISIRENRVVTSKDFPEI